MVSYVLNKQANLKLGACERRGNEVFWATTDSGRELCKRYRQVRDA